MNDCLEDCGFCGKCVEHYERKRLENEDEAKERRIVEEGSK